MTLGKWVAGKLPSQVLSYLDRAFRPTRYGTLNLCPLNLHAILAPIYCQDCTLRRECLGIAFHAPKYYGQENQKAVQNSSIRGNNPTLGDA